MLVLSSEEHFKYTIGLKDQITVILCWRPGCGFCDTYKPNINAIEDEYHHFEPNAPIRFYTLNTHADFIRAYVGAKLLPFGGVPSTIMYHNNIILHTHTGTISEDELRSLCKIHLEAIYGSTAS